MLPRAYILGRDQMLLRAYMLDPLIQIYWINPRSLSHYVTNGTVISDCRSLCRLRALGAGLFWIVLTFSIIIFYPETPPSINQHAQCYPTPLKLRFELMLLALSTNVQANGTTLPFASIPQAINSIIRYLDFVRNSSSLDRNQISFRTSSLLINLGNGKYLKRE